MISRYRYSPFSDMLSLRNAMDQLFAQSFVDPFWDGQNTENIAAPMNVCETENGYQVEVALPGVKSEDIDVTVHQNTLSIKGSYKQQQSQNQQGQQNWLRQEFRSGSFERTLTFPKPINADKIDTHYENGILTVNVPMSETSQPKKISVKSSQGSQSEQSVQAHQQ